LSSIENSSYDPDKGIKILELGTGSGAIAVALATENKRFQIVATDKSEGALTVARDNANTNHCSNITFLCGNWFDCVNDSDFDIILSNPPYVAEDDPHLSEGDLPFEPHSALVAEENGLSDIQCLIYDAKHYLKSDGWLGIEHGYDQGRVVRKLMLENGYQNMRTMNDLAGIDRITVCCWSDDHE
jgi:release factor glutamine methyltransferase